MNKNQIWKILKWLLGIVLGLILAVYLLLYFFKNQICDAVIAEVNKELRVPINYSEVDLAFWGSFPHLSIDLNDVFIKDAFPNQKPADTLLYSERIRMEFNPIDLWNKKYEIQVLDISKGTLKIKINQFGDGNYNIMKPSKDDPTTPFNLELKKIAVNDLRLSYHNKSTAQYYKTRMTAATLSGDFSSDKYTVRADGDLFVMKAKSGQIALLSNKNLKFGLNVLVDDRLGTVRLPKAKIDMEGLPFLIDGLVTNDSLNFTIKSKDILLKDLVNNLSLDASEDIDKFQGDGEIYFNLGIHGALAPTAPTIMTCDFGIVNGSLTEPTRHLKVSDINMKGNYNNEGGPEKEYLSLQQIKFKTAGGPFTAKLLIKSFLNPQIDGAATGTIDLSIAHSIFRFPYVQRLAGMVKLKADFSMRSDPKQNDLVFNTCDGTVQMRNVWCKLKEDKRTFENINGDIYLRGSEAGIEGASLKVGKTDLLIDGVFKNIYAYMNGKGALTTQISIDSDFIRVEDLGTTTKAEKLEESRVFALPDDINGEVNLTVGSLKYDKHRFDHILGTMKIQNRRLHFPQISLVNADALISGALIIEERTPEIFSITAQVASKNLQFKPLFKEWDNFEQSVITDQNISGKAEANLAFYAPFDLRSGIIMKSIDSRLDLKVFNGHLKNVDSFDAIIESMRTNTGKLLIGKKNIDQLEKKLKDISFETLENCIIIRNGGLEIPKMHIASSALDIDLAGKHDFENNIDYRFGFRFRDLLIQQRDAEFGEVVDDDTGLRIYMRMYGTLDKPLIEWDKTAKKEQSKQNRDQAASDSKGILKAEFGLFKGDTTVKNYVPKEVPKESLKIKFGPATQEEFEEEKKQKKDSKLKKTLKNWKEEQEKSGGDQFSVGKGKGLD